MRHSYHTATSAPVSLCIVYSAYTLHCCVANASIKYKLLTYCLIHLPSVLWHCWLGDSQTGWDIRPVKTFCTSNPNKSLGKLMGDCVLFWLPCTDIPVFINYLYLKSLYFFINFGHNHLSFHFYLVFIIFSGVLASEGWWEAWQPSPKVTRSY